MKQKEVLGLGTRVVPIILASHLASQGFPSARLSLSYSVMFKTLSELAQAAYGEQPHGSTMSCPFMRPWRRPQTSEQLKLYVPGALATNSIIVSLRFLSLQPSLPGVDVNTRPGCGNESSPTGSCTIVKP